MTGSWNPLSTIFRIQAANMVKGSLTWDFRLQVFFMNQCPPGPQVFYWGRFEFFRKFADIREWILLPVSTVRRCQRHPAKNLSPVSFIPAINPCHEEITKNPTIFVDTAEKLFIGVNNTAVRQPPRSATPPHWETSPMVVRAIPGPTRRRGSPVVYQTGFQ